MDYVIISTGSKGNAVILNNKVMIDCGVPYKALKPYVKNLKLVLLTHIHGDHFNPATIRRLAGERPTLRFGCGAWLLTSTVACGIPKWRIDLYTPNLKNRYTDGLSLAMIPLTHNVPNCGYKIEIDGQKLFYATDTNNLDNVTAKDYNYYFIEANYEDGEIQERIREKEENGVYAYERQVLNNHLSKQKADEFIVRNAGINSQFIYLHGHEGSNFNERC